MFWSVCYAIKTKWNIYPEKPLFGLLSQISLLHFQTAACFPLIFSASTFSSPILVTWTILLNDTKNLLMVSPIASALSSSSMASVQFLKLDHLVLQLNFPLLDCIALISISSFHLLWGFTFSLSLFWDFILSPNSSYHIFDSHVFISTPISLLSSNLIGSQSR